MADADLSHLDEHGSLRMVNVEGKAVTHRRAVAEGWLIAGESVMDVVRAGRTPKGDVFAAARLAGIAAAKRTADLIPLCHTLPLSDVSIDFDVQRDRIRVIATASAEARTGVEMEAFTAVAVAALTLYDMLKAVSHDMVITDVRLLEKRGGKSDFRREAAGTRPAAQPGIKPSRGRGRIRAAVLTVSDRCAAGAMHDTAGPAVARLLQDSLDGGIAWSGIVPDEIDRIAATIRELAAQQIDLIVTVGGTGCGPRDVTPEATRGVVMREIPGFAEAMRARSLAVTPHAMLQRGVCGIRESSLVVNLPGSEKAACENLTVILSALPHAIALIGNEADPHGPASS